VCAALHSPQAVLNMSADFAQISSLTSPSAVQLHQKHVFGSEM
jgi:hypothetical protein